ncbi:HD domain-containing protein [Nocardia zapadnayensis]|nr:HD domain-containing protein [Nocardia zapadnayensis]MCX0273605.1 HD domain-containing protein [Nocardia zapadnayensis]
MTDRLCSADAELLALPTAPWTNSVVELVVAAEAPAVANHSIRSFLFARLLASHRGMVADRDFDTRLLFAACVLHDIGLSERGNGDQRFEVDGADVAAEVLTGHGLAAIDVGEVWMAIALHTSPGIAERRGTLCELTRNGIAMDGGLFPEAVSDTQAAMIHRAYPRLSLARTLVDIIVDQATARPDKAPVYTIAGELVRERSTPPHMTRLERMVSQSRWGE